MMTIGTTLITSLAIAALHYMIVWEGMILYPLKKHLQKLPLLIRKPLFECLFCMASIWGTASLFFVFKIQFNEYFILCLFAIAGMNLLIELFVTLFEKAIKYLMAKDE